MAATTTTTIRGVSLATRRGRKGDVFDLTLSHDGMEIRRPGQAVQQMSWSRVSEWEIQERPKDLLLTLRGGGSTTPLLVPGWTLDDLEVLMRDMTADTPGPKASASPVADVAPAPGPATQPVPPPPDPDPGSVPTPVASRSERRRQRRSGARWKSVVTVVLLGVVAAAVTLVLLQSAGLISWGFLGPTA
ncbi:MAG: hypothetical protein ACLQU9_01655 [Acidimicrobiales bacterium]|jgi:hypothetical protein